MIVESGGDSLAVWDSGPTPGLYFGGFFQEIEGREALYIARWDGQEWSTVGGGMGSCDGPVSPRVSALRVWDDGTGPALYAGGRFDTAGGTAAVSIARWDGQEWSALGDPVGEHLIDNTQPIVLCFTDYNDGAGPALYVGGNFRGTPGVACSSILKWDGERWHGMDGGLKTSIGELSGDAYVYALEWHDDGDGMRLYAGGHITKTADGRQVNFISRWDGQAWQPVLGGMKGPIGALKSFDDGRGPTLWVAGESEYADGEGVWDGKWIGDSNWKFTGAVARYDKAGWHRPNAGGMEGLVRDLLVRQENGQEVVYAGGEFFAAGNGRRQGFARFDGVAWQDVGDWKDLGAKEGTYGSGITALASLPDDEGIYAAVVMPVQPWGGGVARFDGQHWSWAGGHWPGEWPFALAAHDDGTGSRLIALVRGEGGTGRIERFNGQTWETIGTPKGYPSALVWAFASLQDPAVPGQSQLYAVGQFDSIDGIPANDIARWDGHAWSAVGDVEFVRPEGYAQVRAIGLFDAGDGPKIYVGGTFSLMNGQPCTLAAWDGQAWEVVSKDAGGFNFARVLDTGDGQSLYLGGTFQSVAGVPARSLIRLTGAGAWEDVDPNGKGFTFGYHHGEGSGSLTDVALFDDPVSGPSLMVGGMFETAGGVSSGSVAQLFLCPRACAADLDGSGGLDLFDLLAFVNFFNASDPQGDCDGDGAWTVSDFICYTALFQAGC